MGAGLSRKQIRDRVYRRLKSFEYELSKAGVATVYEKVTTTHDAALVFFEGDGSTVFPHNPVDGGFNIKFSISRASNGEVFGSPTIYLVYKGEHTNYGFSSIHGNFDTGLAKIKELFATPLTPAQRTDAIKIAAGSGFSKAERGYAAQEAPMYDTLEARLTAAGTRTTKLQLAFDALEFANGNVGKAKDIIAQRKVRISARTWDKAITARLAHLNS